MAKTLRVNRAPVLTLWAAIVAQRLGFRWDEALTLGQALAGLNAYAKGVSLGLFEPAPKSVREQRRAKEGNRLHISLLHRAIPVINTAEGLRALSNDRPVKYESVERYLENKFGDDLEPTIQVMRVLANSMTPKTLSAAAYGLYEKFRPAIPAGVRGWGAKGELKLDQIRSLARTKSR